MQPESQFLVFQFEAKAAFRPSVESKSTSDISTALSSLVDTTEQVAQQIEEELQSLLPPFTTVRAEVRFYQGSLLMAGTVVLVNWAGSIVFKAAKDTIEEQLSSVIKMTIQRVFTRVLSRPDVPRIFGTTAVVVNPQTSSYQAPSPAPPGIASAARQPPLVSTPLVWIALATIVLLELFILLDRFFTVTLRP